MSTGRKSLTLKLPSGILFIWHIFIWLMLYGQNGYSDSSSIKIKYILYPLPLDTTCKHSMRAVRFTTDTSACWRFSTSRAVSVCCAEYITMGTDEGRFMDFVVSCYMGFRALEWGKWSLCFAFLGCDHISSSWVSGWVYLMPVSVMLSSSFLPSPTFLHLASLLLLCIVYSRLPVAGFC